MSTGTNTKYIKTLPSERKREGRRERRKTNRKNQRVDKRQTDKHPYLFVHFNVEAIRHLIVLGRKESQVSERNSEPFKLKA